MNASQRVLFTLLALVCAAGANEVERTLRELSALGSRIPGYAGSTAAEEFVFRAFQEIGLEDVRYETFETGVPVDEGASVTLNGSTLPLRCLWPNALRTPTLPAGGIESPLLYCRDASWEALRGRDLTDAVVLLDFESGNNWLRVFELGGRAVIFLAPETTTRQEAEEKFASAPIHGPRFWADADVSARLRAEAKAAEQPPRVRVQARMSWRNARARNVLARLEGTDERAQRQRRATAGEGGKADEPTIDYVILSAYLDSVSVIPTLAPGADQACSIAGLLELARHLKANPPKRSVIFVATHAHFQGLSGIGVFMREYELAMRRGAAARFGAVGEIPPDIARRQLCEQLFKPLFPNRWVDGGKTRVFFIGLDLSSRSQLLGVFARGGYEDQRDLYRIRHYSPVGRAFKNAVRQTLGREEVSDVFADSINPMQGKDADSFFPLLPAFESEIANFMMPGVTLASCSDNRELWNTPFDTMETVNVKNIEAQLSLLKPMISTLLNDPHLPMEVKEHNRPNGLIFGRTVEFNPRQSVVPNTPVPNVALMALRERGSHGGFLRGFPKPLYGVHVNNVTVGDGQGKFAFYGLQWRERLRVEAAGFDQDGEIIYAPDQGVDGNEQYRFLAFGVNDQGGKPLNYVVFRCVPVSIVDLIDPRYLVTLEWLRLIDTDTENDPHARGYALPQVSRFDLSRVESMAVLYVRPKTKLKLTMSLGWVGTRLVLLNITDQRDEGEGFLVTQPLMLRHAKAQVARDLWRLNDARLKKLALYGIRSHRLDEIHAQSEVALAKYNRAIEELDWGVASAMAERAWALESSIYADVRNMADDVVKGVLFYLAMVLPFAYFLERLLFAFASIFRQITTVVAIFLAILGVLIFVHPAFSITMTPFLIFLAFTIMALAALVVVIVLLRFNREIKTLRGGMRGVPGADVNRLAALGAALSMGIGNMRRRAIRTGTTCATIVLLTFTVLCFTSLRTYVHFNIYPLPWKPGFEGIFYRSLGWWPLQGSQLERFEAELRGQFHIAPRSWYVSRNISEALVLETRNADDPTRFTQLDALVGVTSHEPKISGVDKALIAGRWLTDADTQSCLISQATAEMLGIREEDVAEEKDAAISIFGARLRVVGIYNAEQVDRIKGITDEPLTPVNFQVLRPIITRASEEENPTAALSEKFIFFPAQSCAFVSHDWLMANGGTLRSIAATPKQPMDLQPFLRDLMQRWAIILTAGVRDPKGELQALLFSSRGSTALGLDIGLAPAVFIAFLIVFSTMMGSVYERIKEISIYSSVGLSPLHISMLFVAEAGVYATIGSISGYLIGQIVSKVLLRFDLLGALTLNYSSTSALFSIWLVIAVVLLSSLYPAYKAMRLAVPDIESTWSLGEPLGDHWQFRLPFQVRRELALPACEFMALYFEIHSEQAIGAFSTEGVRMESRGGQGYAVSFKCWLAPYDFGISQSVLLETVPTEEEGKGGYEFRLTIHRLSGDVDSWKRSNRRFLNLIRKQFLIWRTVSEEDRTRYAEEGQARLCHDAEARSIPESVSTR